MNETAETPGAAPGGNLGQLVLIVDDVAANRKVLATALCGHCRLKEAEDGEEALRLALGEDKPDLILLDLMMPKVDGREVLRRLRGDPAIRDIPVVVITAENKAASERESLELGADDFLHKPFSIATLTLRVRNMLRRRQLERDLAESTAQASMIFEAAPVPMFVVNEVGRILQSNHRAEEIFGYSCEELRDAPIEKLMPAGNRAAHAHFRADYTAAPVIRPMGYSKELHGQRRNGEIFPVHVSLSPIRQRGRVHVIAGVDDLSERRGYEAQLRESGEKYQQLFMSMSQGVVYHDASGAIVDANPAACSILGLGMDQLLGRGSVDPQWHCIREDGSDFPGETHPAIVALATGERVQDVLMGVYRPDEKRHRWILVDATPLFKTGQAVPYQVHVIFTDITDRRDANQAMRDARKFSDAIVENTCGVLVVLDPEGRIERVNAALERLTGFGRDELLGRTLWESLVPPEHRERAEAAFGGFDGQDAPGETENEFLTREGGRIPFHWYTTVLRDDAGKVRHVIVQGHDIRAIKANEAIIRQDREQQSVLRALLEDGFGEGALEEAMQRCLGRILDISWLSVLPKGCIFLADPANKALRIIAERNVGKEIRTLCANLPYGRCHCGRAAATGQMQYARCVDACHEITYPGMQDHGHYSLPLLAGEELVGVLVLYLPVGFERNQAKEEFLQALARILAGIIQRKQAEASLRESEALYRTVLETTTDGFIMSDTRGRLLEANDAYSQLSGYSRKELLRLGVPDIEACDSERDIVARIEKMIREGSDRFETRHRTKDGRLWPVEVNVSYHPASGGRFFAFCRDITQNHVMREELLRHRDDLEQQVAQRTSELEASRLRLATIIDSIPALLFIKDAEGRYLMVNQSFEQATGMRKEDVIGMTDHDIYPPGVVEEILRTDRKVLQEGVPLSHEEEAPHRDGLYHSYLTTKLPLFNEQGVPASLLGIATDITLLKNLEMQLSRSQAIAHLGSWRLDIASAELIWSDETYRIFGIPVGSTLRFEDFMAHIHPDDRERVPRAWAEALKGHPYDIEHRLIVDGEVKWVREIAEVRFGEDGKPSVAVGSVQDITEIKQTQAALQAALKEAQRMARVKSEFLANMSHEIRTPLNGILGLAQIGQRENEGRQSQRLFDQMFDSGRLLLGIVNDILDFSKIEAGKMRLDNVEVSLDRLIRHVALMCGDRASAKGFVLRIDKAEGAPDRFMGDSLRLAQILVNLVGNAIKFTERGEVVLSVYSRDGQICFRVRDTGIGMPTEHVSNLFIPFEQGDSSITRRFGGTGLGLAITKRLVDMMKGEIRVESRLGEGSTFEVILPLVEAVSLPESESGISAVVARQESLAGLRVLAAEDNPVNRMVIEDALTLEGVAVTSVENGREALDLLQRDGTDAWDVVLTDIHMPIMGGHELAGRIREIAPDLPVIGVTAHAMAEERQRCLDAGMVEHVAKPIVIDELYAAIRRHARRPASGASAQPRGAVSVGKQEARQVETGGESEEPADEFMDWPGLLAQNKGRRAFVDKLVAILLSSHADTPAKLRKAADGADFDALAFAAHSFAGAAGAVMANGMRMQAKDVEGLARSGKHDAFDQGRRLADTIDRFMAALHARQAARARSGDNGTSSK